MMSPIDNATPVQTNFQVPGAASCCKAISNSLTRNAVYKIAKVSFALSVSIGEIVAAKLARQHFNATDPYAQSLSSRVVPHFLVFLSTLSCFLTVVVLCDSAPSSEPFDPSQPSGRTVATIDDTASDLSLEDDVELTEPNHTYTV